MIDICVSCENLLCNVTIETIYGSAELSKQDLIDIENAYAIRQREIFSEYQTLCEQVAVSDDPESIAWS